MLKIKEQHKNHKKKMGYNLLHKSEQIILNPFSNATPYFPHFKSILND
jgi:hypothetical protein